LIIEGFAFEKASLAEVEALRQVAVEFNVELWMSAVTHRGVESDALGIPEPLTKLAPAIAVIVQMLDDSGSVKLALLKDHDNPNVANLTLALDPSTMLLVKK
jgi:hypothetical protein